jgi:hypothetical protein
MNGYLNPAAFAPAPEAPNGTGPFDTDFGNSSVGMVRGPIQRNIDMAVERLIPISEGKNVVFRTEFFNITNTTNFNNPANNVTAGPAFGALPFGLITSTSNNPRLIQFALKYQF